MRDVKYELSVVVVPVKPGKAGPVDLHYSGEPSAFSPQPRAGLGWAQLLLQNSRLDQTVREDVVTRRDWKL